MSTIFWGETQLIFSGWFYGYMLMQTCISLYLQVLHAWRLLCLSPIWVNNSPRTSCVCSGHVMKRALTTMLLVCSPAASCMRLVSWLRYRWFSCRRRGAASLDVHGDTVRSRHPVQFGTEWLCVGTGGGRPSPVVWSGEGGEGVWGADWLRWLGPLGHLQQVGRLRAGCYRVPWRVLSLKEAEKKSPEKHFNASWVQTEGNEDLQPLTQAILSRCQNSLCLLICICITVLSASLMLSRVFSMRGNRSMIFCLLIRILLLKRRVCERQCWTDTGVPTVPQWPLVP